MGYYKKHKSFIGHEMDSISCDKRAAPIMGKELWGNDIVEIPRGGCTWIRSSNTYMQMNNANLQEIIKSKQCIMKSI